MKHKGALNDLEAMIKGPGITITELKERDDRYQRHSFSRAIGIEFIQEVLNPYRNETKT